MTKHLVVVESPAKAKTIGKYLGKSYVVLASYGHVRDLIPKEGAVDPDQQFAMKYQAIERNYRHVEALKKTLKTCDTLFLAPDPDREGEAIAWHVMVMLEQMGALKGKRVARVVFHEITKTAIQEAIKNPRDLAMDLVNAQQTRRALDYLVGFKLSPLLWRKIRPGLSAGRVQSPALRMIVERELDIEAFKSQEYWTIAANCHAEKQPFSARLVQLDGEKLQQFSIVNEQQAQKAADHLIEQAEGHLVVTQVKKKQRQRHPAAPFTTSTLQQEAVRKLGFSAQFTMRTAQQLYEGIEVDGETTGLITYMRTDSVHLAQEAVTEIRAMISQRYGQGMVPTEVRVFKTKSKNAQEAHEAIRPTSALRHPDDMAKALDSAQLKLYTLIWKRTVASHMIAAVMDTVAADLAAATSLFRANGSTLVEPGFLTVYQEGVDDAKLADQEQKMLPPLREGEQIPVSQIVPTQHFTEPPPRYTEASLVKSLEEHGIGRPSTYASIMLTLKNREYVELEKKRFSPTDVGRVVNRFLTQYFTKYVDYKFTAQLEDTLDAVARGDKAWIPVLQDFWQPFIDTVNETQENVQRSDVTQEKMDEDCPDCSKPLSIRLGKRGRFVGCTDYPECKYTRNLDGQVTAAPEVVEGRVCPQCESQLIARHGRYGKFIGCSSYPKCKFIESLEQPEDSGVQCPTCQKGTIVARKSKRGKLFYSCQRYPDCTYALWNEPLAEACPLCKWPILSLKTTKRSGAQIACPQKGCDYSRPQEAKDSSTTQEE